MNYLDLLLSYFKQLDIPYEEHYDPTGMELYALYLREGVNPMVFYSDRNPDHALISISVSYSAPHIQHLTLQEKSQLVVELQNLSMQIDHSLHNEIGIAENLVYMGIGMIVYQPVHSLAMIERVIRKLLDVYDEYMDKVMKVVIATIK